MNKLLTILLVSVAITACDSSSDKKQTSIQPPVTEPPVTEPEPTPEPPVNETREEMIERVLELPPEPEKPHETILGVDVNANNIRDDIERKIALDWYEEPDYMNESLRYAQIRTEIIQNTGNEDLVRKLDYEATMLIRCRFLLINEQGTNSQQVYDKYDGYEVYFNWPRERKLAYLEAVDFIALDPNPSDEEVETYCAQYQNP